MHSTMPYKTQNSTKSFLTRFMQGFHENIIIHTTPKKWNGFFELHKVPTPKAFNCIMYFFKGIPLE